MYHAMCGVRAASRRAQQVTHRRPPSCLFCFRNGTGHHSNGACVWHNEQVMCGGGLACVFLLLACALFGAVPSTAQDTQAAYDEIAKWVVARGAKLVSGVSGGLLCSSSCRALDSSVYHQDDWCEWSQLRPPPPVLPLGCRCTPATASAPPACRMAAAWGRHVQPASAAWSPPET
jgi:hypothetical protein